MTARIRLSALLLTVVLVWASAAAAQDTKREGPSGKAISSGSVTLTVTQAGFLVSASGGEGVLLFKKKSHPFRIGGVGIGGIGASRAYATGEVYNLTKVEDFAGTYVQGRAGYAFGEGSAHLWLENTNGVVLKLRSTTKGVALSLGGDGLRVEMGKSKTAEMKKKD